MSRAPRAGAPALGALLVALLVALVLAAGGPALLPARAAVAMPATTAPSLVLTGLDPVELAPGGTLTLAGELRGDPRPAEAATLVVRRTQARLATRGEVAAWAAQTDAGATPQRLATVARSPLPALNPATAPGAIRAFALGVDAASLRLTTRTAAGPYGLSVEVLAADGTVLAGARGFVVWTPAGRTPAPVGLAVVSVLPTVGRDPATGLADRAALAAATAPGGTLTRAVEVAAALPGDWSLDPVLLASAARPGAPPAARAWLGALPAAREGHGVVLDSWGRADPGLLAASGRGGDLRALLDRVRAAPGPGDAPLQAERLVGGPAITGVTVLPGGTSPEGLAGLAVTGQAVVVPAGSVSGDRGGRPAGPREELATTAGPLPALLADDALGASVARAAAGGGPGEASAVVAELAALALEAAEGDAGPAAVGVLVSRPGDADPGRAAALGAALRASAWARPAALAEWRALPAVAGPVPIAPAGGDATTAPGGGASQAAPLLLGALERVASLAPAVEDRAEARLDPQVRERLAASAVASSPEEMARVGGELAALAAGWEGGVRLVEGSSVTLFASQAALPVTVVNEGGATVRVRVAATSRSPRLRVAARPEEVTLAPGAVERVPVPVEAVSNGRAQVVVRLETPQGAAWGEASELDVRVAAGAETGVLGAAAALIAGLFAFGAYRTIRRSRRRRPARIAG